MLKANLKFLPDAKLELNVPEEIKNADLVPDIIYENNDVLVLNKPAGLLSMAKGEYCPERTLEDFGLLVHRLDRDTSGVVILAKTPEVQKFLRKQFQDRMTHKTYVAVVSGRPKLEAARIDLPIARDLNHPTTFKVDPNGKASETFYQVLKYNVIVTDTDKVVAAAGSLKKKYLNMGISDKLTSMIERRDNFVERKKSSIEISPGMSEYGYYTVATIINNGDSIGSVIILSLDSPMLEQEEKLAMILANMLSNYFM